MPPTAEVPPEVESFQLAASERLNGEKRKKEKCTKEGRKGRKTRKAAEKARREQWTEAKKLARKERTKHLKREK